MKKLSTILVTILSISIFTNKLSATQLQETIKSQIEISSSDLLSFFKNETEAVLLTQHLPKKQMDKIMKQITTEIKTKFPTKKTALSLMIFINNSVAPIFKKSTGISLHVNKIKIDKEQFVLTLDCEIKKAQYLKWSKHKLKLGILFAGKKLASSVFDITKPFLTMYIWTYYIYPRIYKYLLNNPMLVLKYLWLKTVYNIYSEPVEAARRILAWIPLVYKVGTWYYSPQ